MLILKKDRVSLARSFFCSIDIFLFKKLSAIALFININAVDLICNVDVMNPILIS